MRWLLMSPYVRLWLKNALRACLRPKHLHYLGCDFDLHLRDNYSEYSLWLNGSAPEDTAIRYLCNKLAGKEMTLVDIGANAGVFGLPILRAAGPNAQYLGLEPNPQLADRLQSNIKRNNFENAVVLRHAISDVTGETQLFFPRGHNLGQGRLGKQYSGRSYRQPLPVTTKILSDCLKEYRFSRVDLLKVDVEGAEDRVIFPLLSQAKINWPERIYFEVAHQQNWKYPLLDKLRECGYVLEQDFGENHLYQRQ